VDHRLVIGGELSKTLFIVSHVERGSAGQGAAALNVGEQIVRLHVHPVPVGILPDGNVQREQGDVIALQQLGRQVAGAVRCDFDRHI
jgi:hypothetical protein